MIGKLLFLLACLVLTVVAVLVEDSVDPHHSVTRRHTRWLPDTSGEALVASHHLIVGEREPGDILALMQNVHKEWRWFHIVEERNFYSVPKNKIITQINCIDQNANGNGATAAVISGGPGERTVSLKFVSKRSQGIYFVVEIYAKAEAAARGRDGTLRFEVGEAGSKAGVGATTGGGTEVEAGPEAVASIGTPQLNR